MFLNSYRMLAEMPTSTSIFFLGSKCFLWLTDPAIFMANNGTLQNGQPAELVAFLVATVIISAQETDLGLSFSSLALMSPIH
ncbi:hypothetical protein RJT34_08975 [Clitoria ternatea]|uniref:Uncharacterized protein n=1 Tax=Clitoria ternatea TaxID=43366 RepID=A0AAN9K702_CLITE